MTSYLAKIGGGINLQATLAAGSAEATGQATPIVPHHPITCQTDLVYHVEDGVMGCDHVKTGPGDKRTRTCIDHSVALLLMELASKL